jgi:hypothetical protein
VIRLVRRRGVRRDGGRDGVAMGLLTFRRLSPVSGKPDRDVSSGKRSPNLARF